MIMQYITLCTPCMVSHTFIFAIDHAEYGHEEPLEPALVKGVNTE
jgi:hypothetical protein